MNVSDFSLSHYSSGLFLQVNCVLPHTKEVKDRELLLIFCFHFAGEDGERNGRCYGSSVQCQNQGGGHHGAFCKGNVCCFWKFIIRPKSCTPGHTTMVFLWLIQVHSIYTLRERLQIKAVIYHLATWWINFE